MKKEEFVKLVIISSIVVLSSILFGAKEEVLLYIALSIFGAIFLYLLNDPKLVIGATLSSYLLLLYIVGKNIFTYEYFYFILAIILPSFIKIIKKYTRV